jgi:pimeloyl-ACP methyl ester carboxylesterase
MPAAVTVHGRSGPLVMLLPGGAESADGFFPGLVEGLVADPGCRVVIHDRPGTGSSDEPGRLADAADHLHAVIRDLGEGPVVVVGQSLGGGVALLLAAAYPDDVAGLVLLDPTPVNDARGCRRLERVMRVTRRVDGIPVLGPFQKAQLLRGMRNSMKGKNLTPECREALDRIGNLDVSRLADAVDGITEVSAAFREDRLPRVPAVVVTATRKPDNAIRRHHALIADALGVELVSWPDSAHNVQLDHPVEVLEATREVVAAVAQGTR